MILILIQYHGHKSNYVKSIMLKMINFIIQKLFSIAPPFNTVYIFTIWGKFGHKKSSDPNAHCFEPVRI